MYGFAALRNSIPLTMAAKRNVHVTIEHFAAVCKVMKKKNRTGGGGVHQKGLRVGDVFEANSELEFITTDISSSALQECYKVFGYCPILTIMAVTSSHHPLACQCNCSSVRRASSSDSAERMQSFETSIHRLVKPTGCKRPITCLKWCIFTETKLSKWLS